MYSFFQFNDAHHHFLVDDTVDDANREGDRSNSCMKTLIVQAQLCTKALHLLLLGNERGD